MLICCCIIGSYTVKILISHYWGFFFLKNTRNQQPGGGYDQIKLKFKGEVMLIVKYKFLENGITRDFEAENHGRN
jgi:hypothetical protein